MDKIKVLFIDDDIDFGKMLSLALEENGIKVYYSNSLAGIVAAIANPPGSPAAKDAPEETNVLRFTTAVAFLYSAF